MVKISSFETEFLPKLGWKCKVTFSDGDYIVFQLLDNGVRKVAHTGFITREEFDLGLEKARKEILEGQILADFDQKRALDEMQAHAELNRIAWDDDHRH